MLESDHATRQLAFEANQGQAESDVKFLTRGSGIDIYLTSRDIVHVLRPQQIQTPLMGEGERFAQLSVTPKEPLILRMRLAGAILPRTLEGLDPLPGKSHYLIGSDPSRWHRNIPTYAKVRYEDIYRGIDLLYYGAQGSLEHDFIVKPGADPGLIGMTYDGISGLSLDAAGNLVLHTAEGDIKQHKPILYQVVNGIRRPVEGGYAMKNDGQPMSTSQVGFAVGAYDKSLPLIIDPVLEFSTFLGGSESEIAYGVAVDRNGDEYITGYTNSVDFPVRSSISSFQHKPGMGAREIFVTKLNAAGTAVLYSTYLGGDSLDEGHAIAVDDQGNAYVFGQTASLDYPVTPGAFRTTKGTPQHFSRSDWDFVLTKLNPAGNAMVYSTYLGTSSGEVDFSRGGLAVDQQGNAYVTGAASSLAPYPTTPGAAQPSFGGGVTDAVVAKLNPSGTALLYATYLGGSGDDFGTSIAVDPAGNAYVTGYTTSTDFPTAQALQAAYGGGSFDAFVAKVDPVGSRLLVGSYLGGQYMDVGNSIGLDGAGAAYVVGWSQSPDFPRLNQIPGVAGSGADVFVTKLGPGAMTIINSSLIGGNNHDFAFAASVDHDGKVSVTGYAYSEDFPLVAPAFSADPGVNLGLSDAFVFTVNAAGSALTLSTYLGGENIDAGFGLARDGNSRLHLVGMTASGNFPTVRPLQPALAGQGTGTTDAFITKILDRAGMGPVCTQAKAEPAALWAPNHKVEQVTILGVTSPEGLRVGITPIGVTQDEPVNGLGDGDTGPDALIEGRTVAVRAERSGSGNGRVYHIAFVADDGRGGMCSGSVLVSVPHSKGKGMVAIDDGALYDSTESVGRPKKRSASPGAIQALERSHGRARPPRH